MRRAWGAALVALSMATVGAGLPASVVAAAPATTAAPAAPSSERAPSSVAAPRVAPTCTPGQPVVVGSAADRLTVSVPGCANEAGVTGYRVFVLSGAAEAAAGQVDVATGVVQTEVTGLQAGTLYRFRLGARNVDGVGPLGPKSADAAPPFTTAAAMVDQVFADFNGAAATPAQRAAWLADLASGAKTPVDLVDAAEQFAYWQKQSPIIRLFQAYFLRLPDKSGLAYWTGKFRAGKTLADISQEFAKSSEFIRRYGTLTNRQFVEQIYINILGRPGEESGIVHWTGRLDGTVDPKKGKATRGAVVAGFSESSEYVRKTAAQVSVVNLFTGMVLRLPTTGEVDTWKPQTRGALIAFLLGSAAYVTRVGVVAPPAISTTSLPAGTVGTAYPATQLTSVGGTGTTTWSLASGALTPGLSLSVGGLISGTPTGGGTASFQVRVTDAANRSSTRSLSITTPALGVTTASVPDGTVGSAYPSTQLAAVHAFGSQVWSVSAGALPAGLSLSSGGLVSGTPSVGGAFSFTAKVTDGGGNVATKAFSLSVTGISITTASLPDGALNSAYPSTQLAAANSFGAIAWSVASGALPPGLALSSGGAVTGTPTTSGTYNVTIKALDAGGNSATKPFTIAVSSFSITTASFPGGQVGVAYAVDAQAAGGSGYTWSITAGGLPAGLTLTAANGAITGTPTQTGTATFTLRVDGAGGKTASKQLSIVITGPVDWPQADHDEGGRAWSPTEDILTSANVAGADQEWSLDSGLSPVIAGGSVYAAGEVPDHAGTYAAMALDVSSGELQWSGPTLAGGCSGPRSTAVTATAVLVQCAGIQAYRRAAPHDLLWDTAVTDPGISTQSFSASGTSLVAWGTDRVVAYRLSDGQRLWQQLLPSGATAVADVVVSGTTVAVAYDDRVRALNIATGAQVWSKSSVVTASLVAGDGFVYTTAGGNVARFALADGAAGWANSAGGDVVQVVGLDGDTVYAWAASFGDAGIANSRLLAFKTADGTARWTFPLTTRVRGVGITKDLVWIHESDIFSEGRLTNLIALRRTDGVERDRASFPDNSYGSAAFGNGHVVFQQGGSAGEQAPHTLRSWGLTPPRPQIATRMVPTGRVGVAYSAPLVATGGTGTLSWSVATGTLPAGVSLSSAGVLGGTPTAAASVRVQVRVTDQNGRSHTQYLRVEVLAAAPTSTWNRWGHDATLDGYNRGETTIGRGSAAQLGLRWKTSVPAGGPVTESDTHAPVVVGQRLYDLDNLGRLNAWDTTGTAADRTPLWTRTVAAPSNAYVDGPTESGGVLYLVDDLGYLDAVNASTGARIWHHITTGFSSTHTQLLVVGTKILYVNQQNKLEARNTADGTSAWSGATVTLGSSAATISASLASDGTRVFALGGCKVQAYLVSTGASAWAAQDVTAGGSASCGLPAHQTPIVSDGAVFAGSYEGTIAVEAATGAVRWRSGTHAGFGAGSGVVADGAFVFDNGIFDDGNLVALDVTTGAVLWQAADVRPGMLYATAGDLLVGRGYNTVRAYDLLDGRLLWDGGMPDANQEYTGPPAIAEGKIFLSTNEGTKAYGLP